jgi:hypothetical protein
MIKNTLIQVLSCWLVVAFTIMGIGKVIKGEESRDPNPNIKLYNWTTQLLYDTTNACYQGTLRWIVMANPNLSGIPPGFESQRQMLVHCFCVMDKIRSKYEIEEYRKKVFDGEFIGSLFMDNAFECVKNEKTLHSFFAVEDNESLKTRNIPQFNEPTKIPREKPEDSKEESPDQQQEESEGSPQTIFQG